MNFFSSNEWKIQEWVAWCICHRPVETGYLIKKTNLVYDSSEVQEVQIKEVAFNLVRAFVVVWKIMSPKVSGTFRKCGFVE